MTVITGSIQDTYACNQWRDLLMIPSSGTPVVRSDQTPPATSLRSKFPMHHCTACWADRHDADTLRSIVQHGLGTKSDFFLPVPILTYTQDDMRTAHQAHVRFEYHVPTGNREPWYDLALSTYTPVEGGVRGSDSQPFGVYVPGMGRMDIHEAMIDHVQFSNPESHPVCKANHARMSRAQKAVYNAIFATKPAALLTLLQGNGGYCMFCYEDMLAEVIAFMPEIRDQLPVVLKFPVAKKEEVPPSPPTLVEKSRYKKDKLDFGELKWVDPKSVPVTPGFEAFPVIPPEAPVISDERPEVLDHSEATFLMKNGYKYSLSMVYNPSVRSGVKLSNPTLVLCMEDTVNKGRPPVFEEWIVDHRWTTSVSGLRSMGAAKSITPTLFETYRRFIKPAHDTIPAPNLAMTPSVAERYPAVMEMLHRVVPRHLDRRDLAVTIAVRPWLVQQVHEHLKKMEKGYVQQVMDCGIQLIRTEKPNDLGLLEFCYRGTRWSLE